MLRFFARTTGLGIEITSSAMRLAAVSGRGTNSSVLFTKAIPLPAGLVSSAYASLNLLESDRIAAELKASLNSVAGPVLRRAALCLPDGAFRVQTLEFDELPDNADDRSRLIRWRLEKTAFDTTDTVLRHQVLPRQDKGFTVLACVAKQQVISQYEALLVGAGLEPWSVGLSSLHSLNFYLPVLIKRSGVFALAHITEDSFATIVVEAGGARFYRYKEIKRGGTDEIKSRFMREIDDSLHFYMHMDRSQQSELKHLYLTGESSLPTDLADGLRSMTSLEVEVLTPQTALPSAAGAGMDMAAALGAGSSL